MVRPHRRLRPVPGASINDSHKRQVVPASKAASKSAGGRGLLPSRDTWRVEGLRLALPAWLHGGPPTQKLAAFVTLFAGFL